MSYQVDDVICPSREQVSAVGVEGLWVTSQILMSTAARNGLTRVSTVSLWPSPAKITAQGWLAWAGSRLHILTVESSEAEASRYGLTGETARSLIS